MKALQSIKNNIPNTITCLNLLSGAIACIYALHGDAQVGSFTSYQVAFIFIALAAVFDYCDGFVARMLNSVSAIGKELDSLSDCVSFGLAPAMLVYAFLEHYHPDSILNYAAFFIAIFGALRLAKFNVDTTQTTTFKGMPIPANAIFWIGYINMCYERDTAGWEVFALIATLSYLMVCNLPMFSFKMKSLGIKENIHRYLLIFIAMASVAVAQVTGLFYTVAAYFVLSVLFTKRG